MQCFFSALRFDTLSSTNGDTLINEDRCLIALPVLSAAMPSELLVGVDIGRVACDAYVRRAMWYIPSTKHEHGPLHSPTRVVAVIEFRKNANQGI